MKVNIDGRMYVPAESVKMFDMPKLQSPFVRVMEKENYVVTPVIATGYNWVFEDDDVLAVEKINGSNVSCFLQGGELLALNNRKNEIPIGVLEDNRYLTGIRTTKEKNRLPDSSGQHFGELMGPKIQGNWLELSRPEWYPLEYMRRKFYYKSWGRYPKTFETISRWFQEDLFSLIYAKYHGKKVPPEGIVFWQPSTGRMAKLRMDMFPWYQGEFNRKVLRCE